MAQDDYYYEIQLTNKQLIFYFLAGATGLVLSFLAGVMVGRGVDASEPAVQPLREERIVSEEPPPSPPPAEELTYARDLESERSETSLERPRPLSTPVRRADQMTSPAPSPGGATPAPGTATPAPAPAAAEAFSTAEVLHGPVALVERGFPIVAIRRADETDATTREVIAKLASLGADVLDHAAPPVPAVLAPLCQVQSFYRGIPALAAARGLDADAPSHLTKVTKTL